MRIYVNGKLAVLKKDFSFEYVSENRLFLGRDGYSLTISFPLAGCSENIDIFGYIHRADVAKSSAYYECLIVDGAVSIAGTLSVVKVSETEVECQFAEGRCSQVATDPFEDVYINKMNLGSPAQTNPAFVTPRQAWKGIDEGAIAVALPWINESYPTAPNNWVDYSSDFTWNAENKKLSWQPYLLFIAKRICTVLGYTCDFSEWEGSEWRHLIVCNTLPGAYDMPEFAAALPHWTVSEFFEKLELFMCCEFDFDHRAKTVSMRFSRDVLDTIEPVRLNDVVDTYDVQVSQEDNSSCEYIASKRLAYKSCNHAMWNYYSCDNFVAGQRIVKRYDTLAALIAANKPRIDNSQMFPRVYWGEEVGVEYNSAFTTVDCLLYAADVDTYFVFRSLGPKTLFKAGKMHFFTQMYVLQPVNVFGSGSVEDDDTDTEEMEFVPPGIVDTYVNEDSDMGYMMSLSPGGLSTNSATTEASDIDDGDVDEQDQPGQIGCWSVAEVPETIQPGPAASIAEGSADESTGGFYDEMFVAFWPGGWDNSRSPYPIIDSVVIYEDWSYKVFPGFSMRLNSKSKPSLVQQLPQIVSRQKFKFSWLGRSIPDARAIFYIKGKRYLCEKITATFTENGMSQLLKGEFYPLEDD